MCRGREEERTLRRFACEGAASPCYSDAAVSCELCNSQASVYCQADDAFLCRECDRWVHGANFLAQRHIRCFLCDACQNLTQRYLVGASLEVVLPTMASLMDKTHCSSSIEKKCSRMLKKPFLSL